jgi:DNA-binding response OmpR family regulator
MVPIPYERNTWRDVNYSGAAIMDMSKILVAEDQTDLREMIALSLSLTGYEVLSVEDGEVAYLQAQRIRPDLIILDLDLPSLKGTEVCKRLKAMSSFAGTPIMIMSAYKSPTALEESLDAGAAEFLRKPFPLDTLIQRVDHLLSMDNLRGS